ncbi:roadblock/LC7 domain-containing protein [Micromonospora sp. NPDC049044]|uniref:roadblock/LC7 domain-containing protein n=1 Tax=unclassified Micromonospora TaxID=2617518 RepID=UPI003404B6FF
MDADTVLGTELRGLRRRRPEVAGTVLAGTDGLLISSDLPSTDATHLAALAAASFGLGHRVADTVRRGEFRESVVCTTAGCVVTYPAGRTALLTLVTASAVEDLEPLHEEARAVARRTGSVVDTRTTGGGGASAVPDGHAPLAVRTPMATLPTQLRRATRPTWRRPPI